MIDYDRDNCIITNKEYDVCGSTYLSVNSGKTATISYDSTSKNEFICYYHFAGSTEYRNKVTLTIYTGGSQQFGLYFITYQKSGSPAVNVVKSSSINNNKYEITKSNVEKGSIYFDVGDGDYLDRVSIDIFYEEYEDDDDGDYTSSVRTSKSSSGISTGLLVNYCWWSCINRYYNYWNMRLYEL